MDCNQVEKIKVLKAVGKALKRGRRIKLLQYLGQKLKDCHP
jgi:hypothetical protein